MSARHPIIAVTGSSGAGTTTVKTTFEWIFRREKIDAAIVEGDAFHRYDRAAMREKMKEAEAAGNKNFSHFGPESNLFGELEALFKSYALSGKRPLAHLHPRCRGRREVRRRAGHVHALGGDRRGLRPAVLRRTARRGADARARRRPLRGPADRRGARASTSSGSRSCTATAARAATRPRPSWTRSCAACRTT